MPQYRKPDWIKASIALIAMGSITVILFAVISSPFADIFNYIGDEAENMDVDDDVDGYLTMYQTVFGVVFAISMIGLIMWFFLGSHEEEHEDYVQQRKRPPGGNFY